jgi:hypothetical protein
MLPDVPETARANVGEAKNLRRRNRERFSGAKKLSHAPAGRQTMLPNVAETARANVGEAKNLRQRNREAIERLITGEGNDESGRSKKGERASSEKWKKVSLRAGEIAMNKGKRREEKGESDTRRAKRELLGLQTLPNPDHPAVRKKPKRFDLKQRDQPGPSEG